MSARQNTEGVMAGTRASNAAKATNNIKMRAAPPSKCEAFHTNERCAKRCHQLVGELRLPAARQHFNHIFHHHFQFQHHLKNERAHPKNHIFIPKN